MVGLITKVCDSKSDAPLKRLTVSAHLVLLGFGYVFKFSLSALVL